MLNGNLTTKRRKTDGGMMITAAGGLPVASEIAVGLNLANGEEGERPAGVFRQGATQLATTLAINGMSGEATGSVMPNYLRVIVDEAGQTAVD